MHPPCPGSYISSVSDPFIRLHSLPVVKVHQWLWCLCIWRCQHKWFTSSRAELTFCRAMWDKGFVDVMLLDLPGLPPSLFYYPLFFLSFPLSSSFLFLCLLPSYLSCTCLLPSLPFTILPFFCFPSSSHFC